MIVEYELDQWEWQGTTRRIEVDPEGYRDMNAGEIKDAIYAEIRRDAEQNLHLVYEEDTTVREIRAEIDGTEEEAEADAREDDDDAN